MGRTAESQVAHPPPHQGSADQFRILVVERRLPGVLLQPQQSPADPGGHTADRPVRLHQSRFRKGHLYRDDRRQRRDRETETLLPPVTGIRCVEHAVCSTNYWRQALQVSRTCKCRKRTDAAEGLQSKPTIPPLSAIRIYRGFQSRK